MSNNSDPIFDHYEDLDFTDAKPVSDIPALAQLQVEQGTESQIMLRIDNRILAALKARAEMLDTHYQTLINQALRDFVKS